MNSKRREDEEFRQRYQSSQQNKKERAVRLAREAEYARLRNQFLYSSTKHTEEAIKHEAAAGIHLEKAAKEREAAAQCKKAAQELDCLSMDFSEAPEEFAKAVIQVIKRQLRDKDWEEAIFLFLTEDVKLRVKELVCQNTLLIRYKLKNEPFVRQMYLVYPNWKENKEKSHQRNIYLQSKYIFEEGDPTKFSKVTESVTYDDVQLFSR